jgi:hypothetical protein
MGGDGAAGVSTGVNGGVLSVQLPQFHAPRFKGSLKTMYVYF